MYMSYKEPPIDPIFCYVFTSEVGLSLLVPFGRLSLVPIGRRSLVHSRAAFDSMSPAAALAFLIAGPTTTLPAMAAVAGLVTRRVFALYVGFALFGAIVAGYAYSLAQLIW